jgi:hypothetical protein
MSNKILLAAVAAIVLASTGLASAQTRVHRQAPIGYGSAPYTSSRYDGWNWEGVPSFYVRPDPFVGTVWQNVAPY